VREGRRKEGREKRREELGLLTSGNPFQLYRPHHRSEDHTLRLF
jgi:hypothetical protein